MEASLGSFSEEECTRRSQLPSEQELLEGMQAVQAAVAAAEQEDGILGSPRPVLRHQGRPANSGAVDIRTLVSLHMGRNLTCVAHSLVASVKTALLMLAAT